MKSRVVAFLVMPTFLLTACSSSGGLTSYDEPQDLVDAVRAAGANCEAPRIAPGYYGSSTFTSSAVLDIECEGAASRIDITWFENSFAQEGNNDLVCMLSTDSPSSGTPESMVIMGPNWRVGNALVDGQYQDLDRALEFTGQPDAQSLAKALGGKAVEWGTVCDGGYTVQ